MESHTTFYVHRLSKSKSYIKGVQIFSFRSTVNTSWSRAIFSDRAHGSIKALNIFNWHYFFALNAIDQGQSI